MLVCLVLLLITASAAAADGLRREQAYFYDETGRARLADVLAVHFQPFRGILGRGFVDGAHWLRVTLHTDTPGQAVILRVRPNFLDHVSLYTRADGGTWTVRTTGDRHPFSASDGVQSGIGFEVVPRQAATVYYLRIVTTSASLFTVDALTPAESARTDGLQDMVINLYSGILLAVAIWGLYTGVLLRDPPLLLFSLNTLVSMFNTLSVVGLLGRYVLPDHPLGSDDLTSLLVLTMLFTTILFHRRFLMVYTDSRYITWFNTIAVAICALLLVAFLFDAPRRLLLQANAGLALVFSANAIIAAYFVRREDRPGAKVVALNYLLLSIMMLSVILPLLWGSQIYRGTFYMVFIINLVSLSLVFAMLNLRNRQLAQEMFESHHSLDLLQQEIEIERKHSREQTEMVTMLAHELRSPLALIRAVVDNLGGHPSLQQGPELRRLDKLRHSARDMETVIERCIEADRLDNCEQEIEWIDIAELLREIVQHHDDAARMELREPNSLRWQADAYWLRLVLRNLVDNAAKYSAPGSPIDLVLVDLGDGRPCLTVSNQPGAAGMPDPGEVFHKFYRSPGARRQRGIGMGLWLSRSICRRMRAQLDYLPEAGRVIFRMEWMA